MWLYLRKVVLLGSWGTLPIGTIVPQICNIDCIGPSSSSRPTPPISFWVFVLIGAILTLDRPVLAGIVSPVYVVFVIMTYTQSFGRSSDREKLIIMLLIAQSIAIAFSEWARTRLDYGFRPYLDQPSMVNPLIRKDDIGNKHYSEKQECLAKT